MKKKLEVTFFLSYNNNLQLNDYSPRTVNVNDEQEMKMGIISSGALKLIFSLFCVKVNALMWLEL